MPAERLGVVGAGILGLAVARRLTELRPDATVTVLDKEDHVAAHQTGRNSGVVHAGIYYAPGSLKAMLCRRGVELLRPYCEERSIPVEACGKLVVARDAGEVERLDELERRGRANGVPGLRRVEGDELWRIEPHAAGVAGLHSPTTGITDYRAIAHAFADDVRAAGGTIVLSATVTGIELARTARVRTSLDCDEPEPRIVPFRGEYYRLRPEREQLVRGLLYPVPDPAYPFLGVHFTRRVGGGVDVGPNAVLAFAREGYRRRDIRLRDVADTLASPGFRALARRHWRMGIHELHGSLSKQTFATEARRYVPELSADDLVPAPAGVRAQALDPDGSLVDDFRIHRLGPVVAVRNAPSPGATSSMAIAEHIVGQVLAD
jgi:L-2-hydroxyglutarate oxidase LhgO